MTLTKIKPAGLSKPIDLADNEKIRLGTGTDLQIYHSSGDSHITNSDGNLNIVNSTDGWIRLQPRSGEEGIIVKPDGAVELYHDNSGPKLATTSTGVNLGGGTCTFNDNGKIALGTGADLQIYHDGTNSYINDVGSGALRIVSSTVLIRNAADDENLLVAHQNGSVQLYHDGTNRLETSSNGVVIYGFTDARQDSTGAYSTSAAPGNVLARFWNGSAQDNSHAAIQIRASNDNAAADMWWISCVAQSQNYNGFLAFTGRTTSSASTELVRFSNNGDVSINSGDLNFSSGKGIDFSSVSDGSRSVNTNGNVFDDYEEGTFTPTLGWGLTLSTATGRYTKVGRMVTYTIQAIWPTSSNNNYAFIGNLPYDGIAGGNAGGGFIRYTNYTGGSDLTFHQNSNNSLTLYQDSGTTITNGTLSGKRFDLVGFYYAT